MEKLKYILTNSGKFHHFEVAKILHKRNQLKKIICGYPWFKIKNEKIPKEFVHSLGVYNILKYPIRNSYPLQKFSEYLTKLNKINIDKSTCELIDKDIHADVLIALAGVSLNAGLKMIQKDKIYICERSSAHISFQNDLMMSEYKDQNKKKNILLINGLLKMK